MDRDAIRWRFAVEHKCFPVLSQDGETWVVHGRFKDFKYRPYMGKTPDEAIDLAIEALRARTGE